MANHNNSNRFQQVNAGPVQTEAKAETLEPTPTVETPVQTKKFKTGLYDGQEEGQLDSGLKAEITQAGLKCKFIDYKQAKANGSRSRNGWIIYTGLDGNQEPVRRGTLVLAVKTDANAKKQKDRIELQRKAMNRYNQNKEAELNADAKGINSRVIAGYNENG